jgi:hypothetical protein
MSLTTAVPSSLRALANRKAALTRHFGAGDARTLAASAQLRMALLAQAIIEGA